jgi:MFS transporter, OFA family, oxalate/formate antiporter
MKVFSEIFSDVFFLSVEKGFTQGGVTVSNSSVAQTSTLNRWYIAVAAFIVQLALGSVYAWSVFLTPVINTYHSTKPIANLTFSITLLALGVTAGFGGYLNNRFGPRTIATTGGILYGVGLILAGLTTPLHQVWLLYLTYGIIGGIGIGLGYIVPLAMLIKWFPDRRGFITGLAVAGFGLGALATSLVAAPLLNAKTGIGVGSTFLYLGIAYLIVVVIGAQFFRVAPDGYTPAGWTPSTSTQEVQGKRSYTLQEAIRSPRWYVLWLMLALNVTAGAALISVASPLAVSFTGVTALVAATLVSTISIFNGIGRLFWGWISDTIGRPYTFLSIFVIQIIMFALLPSISNFGLLLIPAALIALCYGGGFGTMPAFAADFFGSKNAGTIYGAMLTAWSAGGILGPILISNLDTRTALYIISGIMLISCVLPFVARSLSRSEATVAAVAEIGTIHTLLLFSANKGNERGEILHARPKITINMIEGYPIEYHKIFYILHCKLPLLMLILHRLLQ